MEFDDAILSATLMDQIAPGRTPPSKACPRDSLLHDRLTDLPNRALFRQRLNTLFLPNPFSSNRLAVCYIDLDRFETVNDGMGHDIGDRLLLAAASRLRSLTAPHGHLLARMDSDKFAILLEGTGGVEDAIAVVERALAALAEPFEIAGHQLRLSASAGIVECRLAGTDPDEVIRAADLALHWAKADGRACYSLFDYERGARDVARLRLGATMHAALSRDEFTLHYQPLVDLNNGRLVGFEALARWLHPSEGLLTPDAFIGVAEEAGLMTELGSRLLRLACQQAAGWSSSDKGRPFVSVNVAAAQVATADLVNTVEQALEDARLSPRHLQLEITEHAVVDTSPRTMRNLRELTNRGVRIVMDDFGTGYSNLASLPRFPLQGIKLDRDFVRRLDAAVDTPKVHAFLSSVVALGRSLDLSVTAEGIETRNQACLMHQFGCDIGQGWLFGRPTNGDLATQIVGRQPRHLKACSRERPRWTGKGRHSRHVGRAPLHAQAS